jgi:hypothetical protein
MKTQKLLVIVAISCVLLGVSGGAAMATGCGDGLIQNETFDGSLIIRDEPCAIISSTINGDVLVFNSDHVLLMNNKIGGSVKVVDSGVANVIANTVFNGQIFVGSNDVANVIENETLGGSIQVNRNINALVQKNLAGKNIHCYSNTTLASFLNHAAGFVNCD